MFTQLGSTSSNGKEMTAGKTSVIRTRKIRVFIRVLIDGCWEESALNVEVASLD